jgi:phosphoribosylformimino-5-aminoimidazole carboxamide ribonucleotide (ProFAR) isomerase
VPDLKPLRPGGQWRVNVDIRGGTVTARPGTVPANVIGALAGAGVPAAVIDLDRSTGTSSSTAVLEHAARRHPGRLWAGGRLGPSSPHARRLLDAGAAGVIISSSALFTGSRADRRGLRALARFPEPGRLAVAIDILDGHLMVHGFTTPAAITASEALDTVTQAAAGRCAVLYTDVAAATRARPPDWEHASELAARYKGTELWYAGGLDSWAAVEHAWALGFGAVIGRAYLSGELGLAAGP